MQPSPLQFLGLINNSQQLGSRTDIGRTQAAPIIIELSGDSDDDTTEPQPVQQQHRRRQNRQPMQQEPVVTQTPIRRDTLDGTFSMISNSILNSINNMSVRRH
jgi:hypothetical protein